MRNIILILFFFYGLSSLAQNIKVLPDSSYYYFYGVSDGTSSWQYPDSWYYYYYEVDVNSDTLINSKNYLNVNRYGLTYSGSVERVYGIAQLNNQLYLYDYNSGVEGVAMDFDLSVGDTVFNAVTGLFGQGISGGAGIAFYNAIVLSKDSTLLSNGEYLLELNMEGYECNGYEDQWLFTWTEQTMPLSETNPFNCYPDNFTISGGMYGGTLCTPDALFDGLYYPNSHSGTLACNNETVYVENVSVDLVAGINVSVYPNPSSGKVYYSFSDHSKLQSYRVYSMQGVRVIESEVSNKKGVLDLSSLDKGMYTIIFSDSQGQIAVKRIVLEH